MRVQLPECKKWQFEWLISSLIWYISTFWRRRRDAHKLTLHTVCLWITFFRSIHFFIHQSNAFYSNPCIILPIIPSLSLSLSDSLPPSLPPPPYHPPLAFTLPPSLVRLFTTFVSVYVKMINAVSFTLTLRPKLVIDHTAGNKDCKRQTGKQIIPDRTWERLGGQSLVGIIN